jgi:hypothetical protein
MYRHTSPACLIAWGATAVLGLLMPLSASAQDGLAACGNIAVEYRSDCVVEPPGITCEERCTPVRVETSCASQLRTVCAEECTTTIVEEEVEVCSTDCVTECELNPGGFDCDLSCRGRCSGNCSSRCSTNSDATHCLASCRANCAASCSGGCQLVLPSASCEEICTPSCRSEVRARETVACQIQCQDKLFTECEDRLVGGCKTDCRSVEGALFCEDQFIDHGDNLQQCIDALQDFEVTVEGGFTFTAAGCALEPRSSQAPVAPGLLLLGGLALLGWRRRR